MEGLRPGQRKGQFQRPAQPPVPAQRLPLRRRLLARTSISASELASNSS
jgi:hypothetical protein